MGVTSEESHRLGTTATGKDDRASHHFDPRQLSETQLLPGLQPPDVGLHLHQLGADEHRLPSEQRVERRGIRATKAKSSPPTALHQSSREMR